MTKNVEVISLIFKSIPYLHFIYNQLISPLCKVDGWDVGVRIIANDATQEILDELKNLDISYTIYNAPDLNEFYLNRIYRAYNFGVESSEYDNVCLVNSDFGFSKDWLKNLLKHHDGINVPCGRLIESGKMDSGLHGVNLLKHVGYNFGTHPDGFEQSKWLEFAEELKEDTTKPHGLYGPCLFNRDRFIESGMYPPGNVFLEYGQIKFGFPNDRPVFKSADDYYFHDVLESRFGMKHITVFDAPVYHIIEGEKDA
jgi:hypothetical protein